MLSFGDKQWAKTAIENSFPISDFILLWGEVIDRFGDYSTKKQTKKIRYIFKSTNQKM